MKVKCYCISFGLPGFCEVSGGISILQVRLRLREAE